MKKVLFLFTIAAFCALATNGFLFKKKFVNGCEPNPCKNKAQCVLDAKNQSQR